MKLQVMAARIRIFNVFVPVFSKHGKANAFYLSLTELCFNNLLCGILNKLISHGCQLCNTFMYALESTDGNASDSKIEERIIGL